MDDALIELRCRKWREKSADLMRISKSYKCKSQDGTRMAYIKQALQLQMCAEELEGDRDKARFALAEDQNDRAEPDQATDAAGALGEELDRWEAPDWPGSADPQRSHQGP